MRNKESGFTPPLKSAAKYLRKAQPSSRAGFIALIATIVISSLLVATAFTLSMTSFFARSSLLENEYKERSIALAEACVDEALLRLANNPSYDPIVAADGVMSVGASTCTITSVQHDFPIAGQETIKTKGIFQHSVTNIQVVAHNIDLSIVSWIEIPFIP